MKPEPLLKPAHVGLSSWLLKLSVLAAAGALGAMALWTLTLPGASGDGDRTGLLRAVSDARVISGATRTRLADAGELSKAWERASTEVIRAADGVEDTELREAARRLASMSGDSFVERESLLAEIEVAARAAVMDEDMRSRRRSSTAYLRAAGGLGLLALAGFALVGVRLRHLRREREALDALLPPGHPAEGLVVRASRLSGRTASLQERQSSLVAERLGFVRALTEFEEQERRFAAEARRHRAEIERLQVAQMRDELTGVLNFKYFLMRLSDALDDFVTTGRTFCLLALDLDDFKGINDGYGHHVGDAALRALGTLLAGFAKEGEIVFRKSGDEFYLLMPGATAAEAVSRAEALLDTVNGHEVTYESVDGRYRVQLATSIGVLHCEQVDKALLSSLSRDQLLSETYGFADAALFKAKYSGKGCARIYTTGLTVVDVNPREFPPDFDGLQRGLKAKYAVLSDDDRSRFNSHLAEARRILSGR